ncbi:MAG: hypothetical protein QM800_05470 [Paludibacter sp.]
MNNNFQFPIDFTFRIGTLSNDFIAKDANGMTVAYVRQKMLKLIEEVQVFADESRSQQIYTIKANQWLDFSASYTFTDRNGLDIGRIARKGWASIWKANYDIFDQSQMKVLFVREENPWAKVFDSLLGEVPIVNIFTGFFFHPAYVVVRPDETKIARLRKVTSFFGRRFVIEKLAEFEKGEEERILLGLMMMILLERRRG